MTETVLHHIYCSIHADYWRKVKIKLWIPSQNLMAFMIPSATYCFSGQMWWVISKTRSCWKQWRCRINENQNHSYHLLFMEFVAGQYRVQSIHWLGSCYRTWLIRIVKQSRKVVLPLRIPRAASNVPLQWFARAAYGLVKNGRQSKRSGCR